MAGLGGMARAARAGTAGDVGRPVWDQCMVAAALCSLQHCSIAARQAILNQDCKPKQVASLAPQ